jgi:thiosulfate reductase cytochrome b subunit
MTTFEWNIKHSYIYHENTAELSRSISVAGVLYNAFTDHYRVSLSPRFDDLISPTAYIRKHKYPTLEAAKRAVERKIPPLVAVLKIQGLTI